MPPETNISPSTRTELCSVPLLEREPEKMIEPVVVMPTELLIVSGPTSFTILPGLPVRRRLEPVISPRVALLPEKVS